MMAMERWKHCASLSCSQSDKIFYSPSNQIMKGGERRNFCWTPSTGLNEKKMNSVLISCLRSLGDHRRTDHTAIFSKTFKKKVTSEISVRKHCIVYFHWVQSVTERKSASKIEMRHTCVCVHVATCRTNKSYNDDKKI